MILSLIFKREFTRLLGSKAIQVSTSIVVALMFIGGAIGGYFLRKNDVNTTPPEVTGNSADGNPFGFAMGYSCTFLLMVMIFTGISVLGAGVVEEKASRVVEILLTTVKPRVLLLGKILGIGTGMLVVFAAYMVGIIGGLGLAGLLPDLGTLGKLGVWMFLPTFLAWIIVGYLTDSGLMGALASTVSRQEDLNGVQTPIIFGMMIPIYAALFYVPSQPDSTASEVMSFIPFFSPPTMIMRTALGGVPAWQQLVAFAINIAFIPLLAALAGKIYENSILRTGERVKIVKALRGSN